jgi:DNA-binding NtrC family response regulator
VGIDSPESLECLSRTHREFPALPIIAVARIAGPELVRDIMCAGATDFLFGSFSTKKFVARLTAILDAGSGVLQNKAKTVEAPAEAAPKKQSDAESLETQIVCRNPAMRRILEIIDTVGPTESTVLVQGESGTGKELVAKRIHHLSKRAGKPFVEVNCGALPENLLESQLFGHEKGSFTGAVHRQIGLFEIADGGTIFLDEVGEMSLDMQVKLLRVLQFREFRRVGGSDEIKVDVRVLAATNKTLADEVEKEAFRSDLYYRLNVICLDIPPLRERLEEIPDLVKFFGTRFAQEKGLAAKVFSTEATEKLQKYRWTGNVRELENAVERLLLLSKATTIDSGDLEEHLGKTTEMSFPSVFAPTLTLDEVKRIHIANVLRENAGNKMKTARILKINVKTLYNLIKSLDINV